MKSVTAAGHGRTSLAVICLLQVTRVSPSVRVAITRIIIITDRRYASGPDWRRSHHRIPGTTTQSTSIAASQCKIDVNCGKEIRLFKQKMKILTIFEQFLSKAAIQTGTNQAIYGVHERSLWFQEGAYPILYVKFWINSYQKVLDKFGKIVREKTT